MAGSVAKKRLLSGSVDWKAILIAATGTAGTAVHTAVAGTTAGTYDEVWLYAQNNHTAAVVLTIEFGSADTEDNIIMSIPSKSGEYLVVPWFILQNGATVKAFAATTNVISIQWWVNSITD